MRLWTLHPKHLDPAGLVALWREALLAQAVLLGKTRGYKRHPQLARFQELPDPAAGVAAYLAAVYEEAVKRGYHFDASKIGRKQWTATIPETRGQLRYEWDHLGKKLSLRNPEWHKQKHINRRPSPHPLFRMIPGEVRDWEKRVTPATRRT